jgi:hypothetical protein
MRKCGHQKLSQNSASLHLTKMRRNGFWPGRKILLPEGQAGRYSVPGMLIACGRVPRSLPGPPAASFCCDFDVAARGITAGHLGSATTLQRRDHADLCQRCRHVSPCRSVLSVRASSGRLQLREVELRLRSFAAYSDTKGQRYVNSQTAIEWARRVSSVQTRPRRLADVARFARYLQAEDARHEIPPAVFGPERRPRPAPYILSQEQICQIIRLAGQSGYRTFAPADL